MVKINSLLAIILFSSWAASYAYAAEEMPLRCLEESYSGLSVHYKGPRLPLEGGRVGLAYNEEGSLHILQGYTVSYVEAGILHLEREGLPVIYGHGYFFPEAIKIRFYSSGHLDLEYSYAGSISMYCKKI